MVPGAAWGRPLQRGAESAGATLAEVGVCADPSVAVQKFRALGRMTCKTASDGQA